MSDEAIGPNVQESIPFLLAALSDSNDLMRDTTMWTIGRICEYHVGCIPEEYCEWTRGETSYGDSAHFKPCMLWYSQFGES